MAKAKKGATADVAVAAEPEVFWLPAEKDYSLALLDG